MHLLDINGGMLPLIQEAHVDVPSARVSGWDEPHMTIMDTLELMNEKHTGSFAEPEPISQDWSAIITSPMNQANWECFFVCIRLFPGVMEKKLQVANTTRFRGRGYESWLFGISPSLGDLMFARDIFELDPDTRDNAMCKRFQFRVVARREEIKDYPPPF